MNIGTGKALTEHLREARFFLEPVNALHRQYEALRAYFVDGLSSAEAARRFGYTPRRLPRPVSPVPTRTRLAGAFLP